MMKKLFLLCLAMQMTLGCTTSPVFSLPTESWTQEAHSKMSHPVSNLRYTLGPSDELEITLYERPDLRRQFKISRRGTFTYPLIGQVRAGGLTVAQLEKILTSRLQRAHVATPHVVVTVKAYHNHHIFMLGQVQFPGVYTLPDGVTLRELIVQAQGFTDKADDFLIVIRGNSNPWLGSVASVSHMRSVPGTRVNLEKLMAGQLTPAVKLRSGDTIYIPRRLAGYAFHQVR